MANILCSPIRWPWQPSEDFSSGTIGDQSCRHRGSRPLLAPSAGYECSSSGESTTTTVFELSQGLPMDRQLSQPVEPHPTQAQEFRQQPQFVQEPSPAYERRPSPVITRTAEQAMCAYRFCVCVALLAFLGSILVVELVRVCSSRCGGCPCCVQGDGYESGTPRMMPPVVSTPIDVAYPTTALSSPKGEQETLKDASMRSRLESERAVESAPGCTLFIDSNSPLDDTEISSASTCRKEECSGIHIVDRTTAERDATEKATTTVGPNSTVTRKIEPPLPLNPVSPNPDVDDPGGESLGVESETSCWIYMHMAKSGANLVRSIATKRWRRAERIFDSVQWHRGDDYALDTMTNSHWRLLHGGFVEALRRYQAEAQNAPGGSERGTCAWFTVFRNPVARLISAFDHCQKAPQDPLCGSAETTDLESFAEYWGNFGLRQFALASVSSTDVKEWAAHLGAPRGRSSTWYLVKKYLSRSHEKGIVDDGVLEGVLEQVKETLTTGYDAIGIAEELDATMNLFDKVLSMPGVEWATSFRDHRAVSAREIDIDAVEEERVEAALANPRIKVALKLDILLYEHAVHIFRKQAARASLEQEL